MQCKQIVLFRLRTSLPTSQPPPPFFFQKGLPPQKGQNGMHVAKFAIVVDQRSLRSPPSLTTDSDLSLRRNVSQPHKRKNAKSKSVA
jgi:hypothetical protein